MTKKEFSNKMIKVSVDIPEELAKGIKLMSQVKGVTEEELIRFWIEDGLEREELRFERLLLFADVAEDLDEEACALLAKLRAKYFDEVSDGGRGLDSYLVKSITLHHQYKASSGPIPIYAIK